METVDQIEFDGTLISSGDGSGLSIQRFGSSANIWIKKPRGVQFRNTNERADIIVEDNVDVQSAGNATINWE